jgi:hypothetical protein
VVSSDAPELGYRFEEALAALREALAQRTHG